MSTNFKQLSFRYLTSVDAIAYCCLNLPLASWFVYLVLLFFGDIFSFGMENGSQNEADTLRITLILCILLSAFLWPVVYWRLRLIREILTKGIVLQAQILDISYAQKINQSVKYTYFFEGHTYTRTNWISDKGQVKSINPLKPLAVIVHPERPSQSLIRDVYFTTADVTFLENSHQVIAQERPDEPPRADIYIQIEGIRPSLRQVIIIDTSSKLLFFVPIWIWLFLLGILGLFRVLMVYEGIEPADLNPSLREILLLYGLWFMAIFSPLILWPLLIRRSRTFQKILANRTQVSGMITSVTFLDGLLRGNIRVKFIYNFRNQVYESQNTVDKRQYGSLEINRPVMVSLNPEKPKQALIRDFYIQTKGRNS